MHPYIMAIQLVMYVHYSSLATIVTANLCSYVHIMYFTVKQDHSTKLP